MKEEFKQSQTDDPVDELKKFLSKKNVPEDGLNLRELDDEDITKLLKSMKGKKSLGMDWIVDMWLFSENLIKMSKK